MHRTDRACVNKIHMLSDGRPSAFPPCNSKFEAKSFSENLFPGRASFQDTVGSAVFVRTPDDNKLGLSIEDRHFLSIMDKDFQKIPEGNWMAPLPFKNPRQQLPSNKPEATTRAMSLHRSLMCNPIKKEHFVQFMGKVIDNKHAEVAPPLANNEEHWCLPLFGVYHPQKPDQVRGVFDSSAKYNGIALNDVLLKGPDLTNNLLGVLMAFRTEKIAVMADIQSMFHCFLVREDHRNYLRFLWYIDNDPDKHLVEYRMSVHVFGNRPSPAVASYGLQKAVQSVQHIYGTDVVNLVERQFYVDDGLFSVPTEDQAIDLLQRTQEALRVGGNLRLHKIASNSAVVMKAFPIQDHAKNLKDLNFDNDDLPLQRTLGLVFDLQEDVFIFSVTSEDKPYTRRGVLSTISSIFDPIGFAAPVIVQDKILLRELMKEILDWDEPLSPDRQAEWNNWKLSIRALNNIKIPRMYSHVSLQETTKNQIYIFCDASEKVIAASAYIKTVDIKGTHTTRFIIGKAKVAPTHGHTIPRLELCGAVLAVELGELIADHLQVDIQTFQYFTDSKVVLGYLYNQSKRFYIYVTNRVQRILKSSRPSQWRYIPTHLNPADVATRPIPVDSLQSSMWLQGPPRIPNIDENTTQSFHLDDSDKEVRPQAVSLATHVKPCSQLGSDRFTRFSSWKKVVETVARLQHIVKTYQGKTQCKGWHTCFASKTVSSFYLAEISVIREVQRETYFKEIECIQKGKPFPKDSSISALDPYLDEQNLLRVGGRLKRSNASPSVKNPLIIPGKNHISTLIARYKHERVQHQGRLLTEGAIRAAGIWITGCKRIVSSICYSCVKCRKLRGTTSTQKMGDFPLERLTPAPPFTYVGVDTFGHWEIVSRRTRGGTANSKRWAILFTCLVTRAVHIEVVEELSSSAFINALRRFISIRGSVLQFRSDRGTNFIGATDDLKIDSINVEDEMVNKCLYDHGVQWIFNPPHSSHMGGSWERMIGLTRRILDSMLLNFSAKNLTHDVLVTFMAEVCAILNARPLVPVSTDSDSPFILTPNTLLTQQTGGAVEPLSVTSERDPRDMYRSEWKRVQLLAEEFWTRWYHEYLHTLQPRRKWQNTKLNVKQGDLVLIRDKDTKRNQWPVGIVTTVIPGDDHRVRKVVVKVIKGDNPTLYTRPITEIVVLLSVDVN